MSKLTPYFEVNGNKYEIKRTRYLLAEYDKLSNLTNITNEDKQNGIKAQKLITDVQKLAVKLEELENKYFEDFTNEIAKKQYDACNMAYEEALAKLAKFESEHESTQKLQKAGINILEQIVIISLCENYKLSNNEATEVWESYVDYVGKNFATEWLGAMSECIFGEQEEGEENSFLSQMKAKRQKKK